MYYKCLEEHIKELINDKKSLKKFIVYPYGKWGKYVEKVLLDCKIDDYFILDGNLSLKNERQITFEDLKTKDEYYILLCSDNLDIFWELRKQIKLYKQPEKIIDVCFDDSDSQILRYKDSDPRLATLESCSKEIYENQIKGCVAEASTYRGDFAKYINQLFPDRNLYLFDTFEGFPEKDSEYDRVNNFSLGVQDWSQTNIELVLNKMIYRNQCVVRKGFFPETATDISFEQKFCFVSLDMDLYQPIYEGLKFFYPRLSSGGYIFVHDCRNNEYKGAREALLNFCKDQKIGYMILTDEWGTAVITKG